MKRIGPYFLILFLILNSCKQDQIDLDSLVLENSALKKQLQGSWIFSQNNEDSWKLILVTFSGNIMLYYDSTVIKKDSLNFETARVNEGKLSLIYTSKTREPEESLYLCPEFEEYRDIITYDLEKEFERKVKNYHFQVSRIVLDTEYESDVFYSPIPKSYVSFKGDTAVFSLPTGLSCGSIGKIPFIRTF